MSARNVRGWRERWLAVGREAREFAHDVTWLLTWAARGLFGAARKRVVATSHRRRVRFVGPVVAVLLAAMLLRRRRGY